MYPIYLFCFSFFVSRLFVFLLLRGCGCGRAFECGAVFLGVAVALDTKWLLPYCGHRAVVGWERVCARFFLQSWSAFGRIVHRRFSCVGRAWLRMQEVVYLRESVDLFG
jgi:hypothetical protein